MPDLEPFNSSNIEDMAREAGSMDAEEDALHSKYASLFLAHSYINLCLMVFILWKNCRLN